MKQLIKKLVISMFLDEIQYFVYNFLIDTKKKLDLSGFMRSMNIIKPELKK